MNRVLVHARQDLAAGLAAESDLRDRLPTPEGALVPTLAQMMDARRRTGSSPDDGGLVPGGRAPIHRVRHSKPGA